MTSDVLALIEDPGAANFLIPVVKALQAQGIIVSLYATATLREYAAQLGARTLDAPEDPSALLAAERPRLVFTGTCENPASIGLRLIAAARSVALPTISGVDARGNAAYRFRGTSNDPLAFAPDTILVPDSETWSAFQALGVAHDRMILSGHPHYDTIRARGVALAQEGIESVRRRAIKGSPGGRPVIVFVSEISTGLNPDQFQHSPAYTLHGSGRYRLRTEIVLEEFLDAVRGLPEKPYLVLRLHPKNTRAELADFLPAFDEVSDTGPGFELVFAADAAVGMTSMLLFESVLIGRRALAIIPRPGEQEWLPGAGTVIRVAMRRTDVQSELASLLKCDPRDSELEIGPADAAARCATIIAERIGLQLHQP